MARLTLTETAVAEASAPADGRVEFWDTELPGFGLRVSDGGRKSWQLMYRIQGRKRRMTLGGYPALSLELARDAAIEALREIHKGRDPAAERATLTGGPLTFEAFARSYVERYAKSKKKTWAADARMIEQDLLPAWRRRPADSITRRDVIELLERVVRRGHATAANRRLALIRKMFAWGLEVDMVPTTPVVAIRAPAREAPRERILSEREIVDLWRAWDQIGWPFGPLGKLMLLTAQRRGALAGLQLADIGLADQVWTLPPAVTRGPGRHEVPLAPLAVEILASLPRRDSAFVFPARGHPGRPVSGFSRAAERVARLSGVTDCRFDDLRRTALFGMARLGASPVVIERIANRNSTLGGPVQAIGPAADIVAKRQALEGWAEHVQRLLDLANLASSVRS